ncbi:hypothetical protein D3C81_1847030 [compost metagenome]
MWISANRCVNSALIMRQVAVYDCNISARNTMLFKLCGKRGMTGIILSHHDKTRGILIDPMDNTWTNLTVNAGQILAMIHQRIY